MRVSLLLAIRDLITHRWRVIALGSVFSIAVLAFVSLGSYREALEADYKFQPDERLIAGQAHAIAEYYGSRISPEQVQAALQKRGVETAVPEIHELVGTSYKDAVLMKGVDLERFTELDYFTIRAGRALQPGDLPRQAMIGARLAARLEAGPGDSIRLRGRSFDVVGVFETGSYTENEAWVPLEGAQDLLGWGQDVSLLVFPDNGRIEPGEQLIPGISIERRGERFSSFPQTWAALIDLIRVVTQAIGLAAALSLAAMLWRMTWQNRWQIAVLRSLGLNPWVSVGYLSLQGALIAFTGGILGILGAILLMRWVGVSLSGISIRPQVSPELLLTTVYWLGSLTLVSVLVPVWMLGRQRVHNLLNGD